MKSETVDATNIKHVFNDEAIEIVDKDNQYKKLKFDCSDITASVTAVIKAPSESGVMLYTQDETPQTGESLYFDGHLFFSG